jgi:hypothetical protein
MKKSKTIIMHADEVPSVRELVETINRLKRDYDLLSRIKGSKDIEDPNSFKSIIGFLESFLKRDKRKLNKEPGETKQILKISLELVLDLVKEYPDLTKEIAQEINFIERQANGETESNNS